MTRHGESSIASQDASERTPPPDPGSQEPVVAAPPSPAVEPSQPTTELEHTHPHPHLHPPSTADYDPDGTGALQPDVAQVLRVQDARVSGGEASDERSGGHGSTTGRPSSTPWSSSSGRLLTPADVDDAYEVPREAHQDWVTVKNPAPLSWTRGGLLVPGFP